jgi:hypothetical protein
MKSVFLCTTKKIKIMQKKLLYSSLSMICVMGMYAQLVIPAGCYAFNPFPDTLQGASFPGAGFQLTTGGANRSWDYSGVQVGQSFYNIWSPPDNYTNFPNASAMLNYSPSLGPLTIMCSRANYLNDAGGIFYMGFESAANAYPLAAISGGATDELNILNTHKDFGKNYPIVEFPMEYTNSWRTNQIGLTNFTLTVAAFGLNAAPGQIRHYLNIFDTVMGWGTLTVRPNGMTNAPALLVKQKYVRTVSVMLGCAQAPEPLLAAFGISQGSLVEFSEYYF